MKRIIATIQPFDIYQNICVYDGDKMVEKMQAKMSEIPDTMMDLINIYTIENIEMYGGSSQFTSHIAQEIKEKELTKFNKNKINIKCF